MGLRFEGVWYATPEKVARRVKFETRDDSGTLELSPDGIDFVGRRVDISTTKVAAVSLTRQRIPWPIYAIKTVVLLVLWSATGLPLVAVIAFVAAFDLVALLIEVSQKWIRVDYGDASEAPETAYFADGSGFGLGGIFGGTKDLYRVILDHGRVGGSSMTDSDVAAMVSRRRRRRRLVRSGAAIWICPVLVAVGGGAFLANYAPVAEGPQKYPEPSDPGSLFVSIGVGQLGPTDTYCWAPNSRFARFMNLTNTGPLPVTILGESPFPNERMGNFRYAQVDLAPYRQPSPADTPLRSHATTDPRTDPTLPPTTLNPGGSIEVWVRYVTGTVPPGPGWAVERDYGIVLKYSVLWMTETAAADTKDGIEMEGGNCASR